MGIIEDVGSIADPRARARKIAELLSQQQASLSDLVRLRRETVADLRAQGLTQAGVAKILGVTPGRVAQVEKSADDEQVQHRQSVLVERSIPSSPQHRASFSLYLTETQEQGITPSRRMLEVGARPAPAHVAARLGIDTGDFVFIRRKLMFGNAIPLRISSSWFSLQLATGTALTDPDFVGEGFQVLFDGMNLQFGHAVETLTARMPTHEEIDLLEIDSETPIVHILRSSYTKDGKHVHTLESVCAADRHVFTVQQPPDESVF